MENRNILNKKLAIIGIIFLAALSRLIPHPANFAPIGALALFSGANLNKKSAIGISLGAMLLSDIFLGFHSTMIYVYTSFILITFIGSFLKKYKIQHLLTASLLSSILFFIITNYGAWATNALYTKNLKGLIDSYLMGLPFFRNTLLGDLFYTFSLFYGYKYATIIIKKLKFQFS